MKLKGKVDERGRVIIPKNIREEIGIHPNSDVYFTVKRDKIIIKKENERLSEVLSEISQKSKGKTKTSDEYHREEINKRLEKANIE